MLLNDTARISIAVASEVRNTDRPVPVPCVLGRPGVGKTSRLTAEALKWGKKHDKKVLVLVFMLSQVDSLDTRGLPRSVQQELSDGTSRVVTIWSMAGLMYECHKAYEEGYTVFLFLDELLQAELHVQKGFRQLLTERRLGSYALPPTTYIIAASNRLHDKAGVVTASTHFINAMMLMHADWSCEQDWVPWATRASILPTVIDWALKQGGKYFADEVPSEANQPFCTPRSLTYAEQVLRCIATRPDSDNPDEIIMDPVTIEAISGLIDAPAANSLVTHTQLAEHFPDRKAVIDHPDTAKLPETRPDVISALSHWIPQLAPTEQEILGADPYSFDGMSEEHDQTISSIVRYADRMPSSWRVSIWVALCLRTNGKALQNKTLQQACAPHTKLIRKALSAF